MMDTFATRTASAPNLKLSFGNNPNSSASPTPLTDITESDKPTGDVSINGITDTKNPHQYQRTEKTNSGSSKKSVRFSVGQSDSDQKEEDFVKKTIVI